MEMISIYTETLEDLLENQGYGTDEQSQSLTEIINLMQKFPNFYFELPDDEVIDLPMLTLFIDKYDIREIGAETEQMFMHFWREKTNELLVKYAPKMQKWLDNFNDLFKFTVQLSRNERIERAGGNKNTYYLNPVTNAPTSRLKVQDVDESNNNSAEVVSSTRDVLQSVWGKTRATLMNEILNLKDIFNDCLSEFETIFLGVF